MKGISVLQTFAGKTCIKIPCTELEKGIIPLLIAWIIKMIPSFSLNPVSIKPPPPPVLTNHHPTLNKTPFVNTSRSSANVAALIYVKISHYISRTTTPCTTGPGGGLNDLREDTMITKWEFGKSERTKWD